jgi:hypothetical protein
MLVQGASVLAIANLGDDAVGELESHTVYVEERRETLLAICEVIPRSVCLLESRLILQRNALEKRDTVPNRWLTSSDPSAAP